MVLTAKLVMRQSQSLVMTPQLLQAIKLLQFSNLDLTAFIEEELERNPLLERAEESPELPCLDGAGLDGGIDPAGISPGEDFDEASEADWSSAFLTTNGEALEASLGTELSNSFDDGRTTAPGEYSLAAGGLGLSVTSWSGPPGGTGDGAAANLEAYIAAPANLKDHLEMQLGLATAGPADRLTGQV
ncbi:MAG: RNA polymerase factor sigma-54, partial [Methylocella sp.]